MQDTETRPVPRNRVFHQMEDGDDRGLLEELGNGAYGKQPSALAEIGRWARIFVAEGSPPPELAPMVAKWRTEADDEGLEEP